MPSRCLGFEDPALGPARDCTFARDGRGGRAHVKKTSSDGRCMFCSIPALQKAFESRVGKGNIVAQLKGWREAGSPTYEFALAHSSLVALDPAQLLWLRYSAGERTKFDLQNSWLHKKMQRLTHFVLGRPAMRTPRLSDAAAAFVRHCRYYGQRNTPDGYPKNNQWIELVGKDVVKINDYGKEIKHKKAWKGRSPWSMQKTVRAHRQAWWRAHRKIRGLLMDSVSRGQPVYQPLLSWAFENKVIRPAGSVRKRKPEKPLDEHHRGRMLQRVSEAASTRDQTSQGDLPADPLDDMESPSSHSQSALPADPLRQVPLDDMESPTGQPQSALPPSEMMSTADLQETGGSGVMVDHHDGPGGLGAFQSRLLETLQQALVHHPNPQARDLRGLRRRGKVIVLNGAPYQGTMVEHHFPWVPTMYVAGKTPYAAFEVIRLVMEEKVRQSLLTQVPPELHVSWQLGKPPAEAPPSPWKPVDGHRLLWSQFQVQPPEAPRIREHLSGYLQQTSEKPLKFRLVMQWGISAFEKAFNHVGIRLEVPDFHYPNCLARIVHNLGAGDSSIHRVCSLLHNVLGGRPIQLRESNHPICAFTTWLRVQPNVVFI
ncbi:unnamed protein product [Symbiodinium sp. CCMP2592]|nr:unnamed protein product [Symbiodinium sp. CCMP2592]CAE7401151.1 unnamed protein product [Symbiodinium sp. CCMP2592]CAE7466858.1 unnamed protein product [Symbiodinium sp. CCMP2592]